MFEEYFQFFRRLDELFETSHDKVYFKSEENKPIMIILYKSVEIKIDLTNLHWAELALLNDAIAKMKERIDDNGINSVKVNY